MKNSAVFGYVSPLLPFGVGGKSANDAVREWVTSLLGETCFFSADVVDVESLRGVIAYDGGAECFVASVEAGCYRGTFDVLVPGALACVKTLNWHSSEE